MRERLKRTTAGLLVAALVAVLFVVAAGPAGASVAAKNKKFCTAVSKVSDNIKDSGNGLDQSSADAAASSLNKAASSAPGKVKSALKTMASTFQSIADADNKIDAAKAAAGLVASSKYRKAVTTFIRYYTKNCVSIPSIPTIPTT